MAKNLYTALIVIIFTCFNGFAQGKIERPQSPQPQETSTGMINNHAFVDLGLPSGTKWATCNIGANNPWDFGDYFAWGESESKSVYTEDNCKTINKSIIIGSQPDYNVATKKWGKNWSIPERSQLLELIQNCKWEWQTLHGNNGYKITGPNNKSIFIPCAGGYNGANMNGINSLGVYWGYYYADSFELANDNYTRGLCLCFDKSHKPEITDRNRWYGFSIRPVAK